MVLRVKTGRKFLQEILLNNKSFQGYVNYLNSISSGYNDLVTKRKKEAYLDFILYFQI